MRIKVFIAIFFILFACDVTLAGVKTNGILLSKKLGWIEDLHSCSVCKGFYKEFEIPHIPSLFESKQNDTNYHLKADNIEYSLDGYSTFKGNVEIVQKARKISADVAHVKLDKKTGKACEIDVEGNVRFVEYGKLLLAKKGHVNLIKKRAKLTSVIYRVTSRKSYPRIIKTKSGEIEKHFYKLNAWGTAANAEKRNANIIDLDDATYTTCPPVNVIWKISADKIILNSDTGWGDAFNTVLRIKKVPIFYFPYFNFPIDKRRKTGFLIPSLYFSSNSGAVLMVPYYFNIAPNYDATITPNFITKRGVLINGLFRYLTSSSSGDVYGSVIPIDYEFKDFKKEAVTRYNTRPTFDELQNNSNTRYAFALKNRTNFKKHWVSYINYNYVSDDYYLQDFKKNSIDNSDNHLLQQAKLNYFGQNWNFLVNLQDYQTLHTVNKNDVENQYAKLPQLKLNGHFPNRAYGLGYGLSLEGINFTKEREPWSSENPFTGNRFSLRPMLDWYINKPYGYIKPRLQLQMTQYQMNHFNDEKKRDVAIPIFDAKAGLYFDRDLKWLKNNYRQTLEPVFYYLYVPYRDQNKLPFFDTHERIFNYDIMFYDNRFSGIDRIGDANQITLGVTTRFIDSFGNQKADAKIGQIRYFEKRKIMLCSLDDCLNYSEEKQKRSPIAAYLAYYFNPNWSAHLEFNFDSNSSRFDYQNLRFQYLPNQDYILNFEYNFIRNGDMYNGVEEDLKQTDVSGYLKINNNWSVLGRLNYNWNYKHYQTYFYGVTFDNCCWALRFIVARTYMGISDKDKPEFDNAIYLQFALKGLGSIGSRDPRSLLNESIGGYKDFFGEERL